MSRGVFRMEAAPLFSHTLNEAKNPDGSKTMVAPRKKRKHPRRPTEAPRGRFLGGFFGLEGFWCLVWTAFVFFGLDGFWFFWFGRLLVLVFGFWVVRVGFDHRCLSFFVVLAGLGFGCACLQGPDRGGLGQRNSGGFPRLGSKGFWLLGIPPGLID